MVSYHCDLTGIKGTYPSISVSGARILLEGAGALRLRGMRRVGVILGVLCAEKEKKTGVF